MLRARAARAPARLRVPALGVDARIDGVGTDPATRELAIPPGIGGVSWWDYGARPGDRTGQTVLAAHVDWGGREGIFFDLYTLQPGSILTVQTAGGRLLDYRVVSNVHIAKPTLAQHDLFATTGPPRLVLITCGGTFDASRRSYRDNIVVEAVPVTG